jgi:hypothetical protein
VNGNIDGTYVHIYYALSLVLGKIGKRYVVTEKERKTAVVILEIQRVAHTLRQLIDKAENALVAA